jgi:N-acetyl-anhydromuramyl-L-alanine amidase AmpD
MRDINKIIIHCADTPNGKEFHVSDIDKWHKEKGWICVGYHFILPLDGKVEVGRDAGVVGAHAKGYNKESLGICMIGRSAFYEDQWFRLRGLIRALEGTYNGVRILGHNELDSGKVCPGFNVRDWLRGDKQPLEGHILV